LNRKPERGIRYLIAHRFLEGNAQAVARFFLSRKGLSRQMIGEYLGNLQDPFAMEVLQYVLIIKNRYLIFLSNIISLVHLSMNLIFMICLSM
jgi:hypothetical protein